MSTIATTTQSNTSADAPQHYTCPLCCEDNKATSEMCFLSNCSHSDVSCKTCIVRWIQKAESSGHYNLPACPFCRVPLKEDEARAVLGRPFQPRPAQQHHVTPSAEEIDELTLQWIQSRTQPCPGCGARIEKLPDGCDKMECLCGYRFCYKCGAPGAECDCTPSHHYFWDSIVDRIAYSRSVPDQSIPAEINWKAHMEKRKGEPVRQAREIARDKRYKEDAKVDEVTCGAKWLFCSKPEKSLYILQQLLRRHTTCDRRAFPHFVVADSTLDAFLKHGGWLYRNTRNATTRERVMALWRHRGIKETSEYEKRFFGEWDEDSDRETDYGDDERPSWNQRKVFGEWGEGSDLETEYGDDDFFECDMDYSMRVWIKTTA